MEFRCKGFSLNHSLSTQKVGTDAILLCALSPKIAPQSVLDIGCGCGIIALCMAQRHSTAFVKAIDIDHCSISQAWDNFKNSPFTTRLNAQLISLQDLAKQNSEKFDLIISNPPYFLLSLKSPKWQRNRARHTDSLPFEDLAIGVSSLLSPNGIFCLILPTQEFESFQAIAQANNLYLQRRINIFSRQNKPCERVGAHFALSKQDKCKEQIFVLRNQDNTPSHEYLTLVSEFLL
jgi:Predicted O-methyltransferase